LTAEHERGINSLSLLAPQLKQQVTAIRDHLRYDESVVAETNAMMELNVSKVSKENSRLKQWANESCSETCVMSGLIAVVVLIFFAMVAFMRLIPAP